MLLLAVTPLSAQSVIDSLQSVIEDQHVPGNWNQPWRSLVSACGESDDCLEAQMAWAAATLGDSAVYEVCMAAGASFIRKQKPYRALTYQKKGYRLAAANRDTLAAGQLAFKAGYAYTNLTTESDSGAYYLYRSIELLEQDHPGSTWSSYFALGYLNDQLGLRPQALVSMTRSYRIARGTGRRIDYGYSLFHLLQMSLQYEARDTFNRYWPDYVEFRATSKSINAQHDAFLNFVKGDDAGLEALKKVVDGIIDGDYINPSSTGLLFSNLSSGYVARGQYELAEKYLRIGITKEEAIGREGNMLRYYQQMADLGEFAGSSDLVAEGLRAAQTLRDSMASREYRADISRMEVRYKTQQTRTELAESQLALIGSTRQRNQLLLGGAGLGLFTLFGFFFYRNRLKLQRLKTDFEREKRERDLAEARRKTELSNLRSLIEGQEIERSRVAKDLHDGLGGLLTTVKAHVASIPDTREAELLIDRACTSVRRIAHNMVPQTLAESGLSGSLGDLTAQLRVQGYEVDLEIVGDPDARLDLHQRTVLLRIAQELTHNVVKHAEAKSILLQLVARPGLLLLTVEDDGKGFNLDHARRMGGLGLNSIEQRVAYLEGKILYDSRGGEGTTVTVEVG